MAMHREQTAVQLQICHRKMTKTSSAAFHWKPKIKLSQKNDFVRKWIEGDPKTFMRRHFSLSKWPMPIASDKLKKAKCTWMSL
jgi:hypothetical protein